MSLRKIDFSQLPSPIGRFRDMVKNTLGTEPAAMVTGWYQSLGRRQAETRERTRRAVTRPDQWAVERDRLRADYQAALFAALVDPRIRKLTLERCLTSFGELIETDLPLWRSEGNVYGVLRWGIDLPDLLQAYPGELTVIDPVDPLLRPAGPDHP